MRDTKPRWLRNEQERLALIRENAELKARIEELETTMSKIRDLAISRIEELEALAQALIDDVRARHPGEELRCPHMIALDEALKGTDDED